MPHSQSIPPKNYRPGYKLGPFQLNLTLIPSKGKGANGTEYIMSKKPKCFFSC